MWAAAVLQPGGLKQAQLNLVRQDTESYSPRLYCPETRKEVPLFPGYLLVKIGETWGFVKNTRGIASVVMMGVHLGMISDNEIDRIKALEGPDGLIREPHIDAPPKFRRNQRVRLLPRSHMAGNRGSLVNVEDYVTSRDVQVHYIRVLMRLLGRSIPLVVREDDLVAI